MNRLVVVVPLRENGYEEARRLLEQGPPIDLEATRFERHEVYLTRREVVFVFETPRTAAAAALELPGEDRELWRVAAEWRNVMAGRPRTARTVYAWSRGDEAPGDDAA
jgi:hypothetical protein